MFRGEGAVFYDARTGAPHPLTIRKSVEPSFNGGSLRLAGVLAECG